MRKRPDRPGLLRRLGVAITAVAVMAGAGVAVAASPAYAAPPCVGDACTGKDPQTVGCATTDHTTITRYSVTVSSRYTYQLRYSTACKAVWGRFVRNDCDYPSPTHHWLKVEVQIQTPYGSWTNYRTQTRDMWNRTSTCNGGTAWTNMAAAQSGTRARLCRGTSTSSSQPSSWTCSDYYLGGGP